MNSHSHIVSLLVIAALAQCAGATIGNGGFETMPAFAGWTVSGAASLSSIPPAAPTDGTHCALLTAGPTGPEELAQVVGCNLAQLQAATACSSPIGNGTALLQTFSVSVGETITFDYSFNNAELANEPQWADCALLVVNGEVQQLASAASLPHGWTPVQRYAKSASVSGQVTVAFVVCNLSDTSVSSQLMIDNVTIAAPLVASCGRADTGGTGGSPGPDGRLDTNDFVVFIDCFFAQTPTADMGSAGGMSSPDGAYDTNDFVAFIDAFFTARAGGGC